MELTYFNIACIAASLTFLYIWGPFFYFFVCELRNGGRLADKNYFTVMKWFFSKPLKDIFEETVGILGLSVVASLLSLFAWPLVVAVLLGWGLKELFKKYFT